MIEERASFSQNTFNMWRNLQNDIAVCFYSSNLDETSNTDVEYDSQNRRIINRSSLYQHPDLFYEKIERTEPMTCDNIPKDTNSYDWTQHSWCKAGEETLNNQPKKRKRKPNMLQKKLSEALAQPLKLTKAERMMQKMGWSGGALGKAEDGIKEPVAPNAAYATSSKGLGHNPTTQQVQSKTTQNIVHNAKIINENFREYFNTNTLLHILDFVCDDTEIEIAFDPDLSKKERKIIHNIVGDIMDSESVIPMNYDSVAQMDIINEIHKRSNYLLSTYSEDLDERRRQLYIYKEAPDHVFLITPEDLNENNEKTAGDISLENESENKSLKGFQRKELSCKDSIKNDDKSSEQNDDYESKSECRNEVKVIEEKDSYIKELETVESLEIQEISDINNKENSKIDETSNKGTPDINTELIDKAGNTEDAKIDINMSEKLKTICNIKDSFDPKILQQLLEYVIEFASNEDFKELRFLGLFEWEQIDTINYLLNNMTECLKSEKHFDVFGQDNCDELKRLLISSEFLYSLKEDLNESVVIYKTKKKGARST